VRSLWNHTARMRALACSIAAAMAAAACVSGPLATSADEASADDRVPPYLRPLSDQPWSVMTADGWNYLRRTSSRDDDIVADPSAPRSGPDVLRIIFPPTMAPNTEPTVHWLHLPGPTEVYARWWIKLSPNWKPSPAGGGKMTFLHAAPSGQGQVYMALFGPAPHLVEVNTEWSPYGQKVWDQNVNITRIRYGRWYEVDWYVRFASPPGAANGILRWWVDGTLNGDHTDVVFPAPSTGFEQFEFAPTLQNPPPEEQYMYVDHTTVSIR
jgi:hypothetical protein